MINTVRFLMGGFASLAPPETVAPVYKKGKIKSLKKKKKIKKKKKN